MADDVRGHPGWRVWLPQHGVSCEYPNVYMDVERKT